MRPWEAVLVSWELIAVVLLLSRRRTPDPARHVAVGLSPVAALVQVVVEGHRWQLVPAQVLAGGLAVLWLARMRREPGRGAVPKAAAGALALAVAAAPPVLVPVFDFPAPTGPHAIGTRTYHWVDAAREEVFTADPADRRELVVQLWYPATPEPSAEPAPYVPDSDSLGALAELAGLPSFALSHLKYVHTNAVTDAPAADGRFPLLVLATGRGGYRQYNTLAVEELVSHGYVVAAIDHPYSDGGVVFPDGRVVRLDPRMMDDEFVDGIVPFLAGDASFTLEQAERLDRDDPVLSGRIDTEHAGLFGLSLGGMITAQACSSDRRFRACLPIDCWMTAPVLADGLTQPTMWLTRDTGTMREEGWAEEDVTRTWSTIRAAFEALPTDGYVVRIPGMYHPDFGDTQMISPLFRVLGLTGPLDGEVAHRLVNAYTLAFFDRYLKGRPAPLLDREPPAEVLLERRTG